MSLFQSEAPSAPPAPTVEQAKQQLSGRLKMSARSNYNQLCRMQKEGIAQLWQHPHLTPQQACDAGGTDMGKLFQAHGALTSTIVAIATLDGVAPDISLPTHDFTINTDGTVTVGTGPYVP